MFIDELNHIDSAMAVDKPFARAARTTGALRRSGVSRVDFQESRELNPNKGMKHITRSDFGKEASESVRS